MECVVMYEGNEYRFCKDAKGKPYWVGHKRCGGSSKGFIGLNCIVPLSMHNPLLSAAMDTGDFDKAFFCSTKKEKKPTSSPRTRKVSGPSISIF